MIGLPWYGGILKSKYWFTSASRSILPCSTSCITAVQVNNFEIDPALNIVVAGSTSLTRRHIRVTEAALGKHLAIFDNDHHSTGDVVRLQRERHETIEPGIGIRLCELWRSFSGTAWRPLPGPPGRSTPR